MLIQRSAFTMLIIMLVINPASTLEHDPQVVDDDEFLPLDVSAQEGRHLDGSSWMAPHFEQIPNQSLPDSVAEDMELAKRISLKHSIPTLKEIDASKYYYKNFDIFTIWWPKDKPELKKKVLEMIPVIRATRNECLKNSMKDPPNTGKGLYFNYYVGRPGGSGVGTNTKGLPYCNLPPGTPPSTWKHESFHVMQYNRESVPYNGDSSWYIEASASWYALTKAHSGARDFSSIQAFVEHPQMPLWFGFGNCDPVERKSWALMVHQYILSAMLWYQTEVSKTLPRSAIYRSFNYAGKMLPQEFLFQQGGEKYRQGFVDWIVHTVNDFDYLTDKQKKVAKDEAYMYRNRCQVCGSEQYAVVKSRLQKSGSYDLAPAKKLWPGGWAFNVLLLKNAAAGKYKFSFKGNSRGTEGASSYFVAKILFTGASSGTLIKPFVSGGRSGSAFFNVKDGRDIRIIVLSLPNMFEGRQSYGYKVKLDFTKRPLSHAQECANFQLVPPLHGYCYTKHGRAMYQKTMSKVQCEAQCRKDPACIGIQLYPEPSGGEQKVRCDVFNNNGNANAPSGWEHVLEGDGARGMDSSDLLSKVLGNIKYSCLRCAEAETTLSIGMETGTSTRLRAESLALASIATTAITFAIAQYLRQKTNRRSGAETTRPLLQA